MQHDQESTLRYLWRTKNYKAWGAQMQAYAYRLIPYAVRPESVERVVWVVWYDRYMVAEPGYLALAKSRRCA